jgi:hypothetical protein
MAALLTMVSLEVQPLRSSFGKVFMGAAGTDAAPSDDQFNRVSFLSHFEGSNNGVNNAFDDGSTSNHTITANGNVTQGSFSPYRTNWGVDFPDSDNNWVTVSSHADLAIGANDDYTFEYFIFFRNNAIDQVVLDGRYANNYANGTFPILSIRGLVDYQGSAHDPVISGAVVWTPHSGTLTALTSNDLMVLGSWNHVAAVRSSGTVNLYLNGIRQTANYTSNTTVATQSPWKLGDIHHPTAVQTLQFKNILSNFRYVKGTAVYSGSSFTVPTSPLTAITNTKLLLFQSNRIVDNSATGHTLTPNGLPAVTAFGPFLTSSVYDPAVNGASAYFRGGGTDDYLITANASSDFNLGTGQFTFECWAYLTSSAQQTIMGSGISGSSSMFNIFLLSGVLQVHSPSAVIFSNAGTLQLNAWQHIVVERDSNNDLKAFLNGTQTATTNTTADFAANNIFKVGTHFNGTNDLSGYISDVRFIKGSGVAPSAGGPTAPLTAITNTKLLLNMADGQAIDSAAQHNLSLENGTNISTAQAKFGNSSLYFDGTTDTATVIGSENVNFGTANFTVEGWIRPASFSGYKPNIISKWTNGSRGWAVRLVASGSGFVMRFTFSTQGSNDYNLDATTVLAFDTWHHFAFVQNSNTVTCYSNGTANGTISCSTIFASTNPIILGDWDTNQADYNGYIDDIRVTTGVARYTSNFTAPAEPFADKGQ